MNFSIVAPIVAVLALLLKAVFGIEIGEEMQAQIVDAIITAGLAIIAVYGVIKGQQVGRYDKKEDSKNDDFDEI